MLAFVANTTASWESFMNTTNDRETDHAQGLLAVTESAASSRLTAEPILLPASARIDHRARGFPEPVPHHLAPRPVRVAGITLDIETERWSSCKSNTI